MEVGANRSEGRVDVLSGLTPNKAERAPSFGGRRGLFGTRFVKIGVLENALPPVSTPNRRFARLDEREFSGAEVDADRSEGSDAFLWRLAPTEAVRVERTKSIFKTKIRFGVSNDLTSNFPYNRRIAANSLSAFHISLVFDYPQRNQQLEPRKAALTRVGRRSNARNREILTPKLKEALDAKLAELENRAPPRSKRKQPPRQRKPRSEFPTQLAQPS